MVARPHGQQQQVDGLAHVRHQGLLGLHQQGVEVLAGMTGHGLVSQGFRNVQIGSLADNAVELAAKLQLTTEQPLVDGEIRRHHG